MLKKHVGMRNRFMVSEKKMFLHPSAIYASKEPTAVTTILGTCVSVCVHDRVLGIGGINHFIMPWYHQVERSLGKRLADCNSYTKYGNVSIDKLLQKMFYLGSKHENLQAKIFGGMSREHANMFHIGERNAEVARLYLAHLGIPIVAQHMGGAHARKLIFHTHSGEVLMKLLLQPPPLHE